MRTIKCSIGSVVLWIAFLTRWKGFQIKNFFLKLTLLPAVKAQPLSRQSFNTVIWPKARVAVMVYDWQQGPAFSSVLCVSWPLLMLWNLLVTNTSWPLMSRRRHIFYLYISLVLMWTLTLIIHVLFDKLILTEVIFLFWSCCLNRLWPILSSWSNRTMGGSYVQRRSCRGCTRVTMSSSFAFKFWNISSTPGMDTYSGLQF